MAKERNPLTWAVIVGVIAPAAIATASIGLIALWWGDLPTVVPKHWNASGQPDDFGSRWSFVATLVVLSVALPGMMAAFVLPGLRKGARGFTYRMLPSMGLAMAGLGAVMSAGFAWIHRGVPEGGPWPSTTLVSLAGLAVAIGLGFAGFFAQPRYEATRARGEAPTPLPLTSDERVVWMRSATIAKPFLLGLIAVAGLILAGGIAMLVAGLYAPGWIMLGTFVFISLAAASATSFHVTVDQHGLTATGIVGWPKLGVTLDKVADARVVQVDALGEFGGFGIRAAPGAVGVILRNGEAIEVTTTAGKRVVVTVADAGTAASLLLALAARHVGKEA